MNLQPIGLSFKTIWMIFDVVAAHKHTTFIPNHLYLFICTSLLAINDTVLDCIERPNLRKVIPKTKLSDVDRKSEISLFYSVSVAFSPVVIIRTT